MALLTSSPSSSASRRAERGPVASSILIATLFLAAPSAAAEPAKVVVSLEGCTLRVETGRGRRVFPVGVARLLPDGKAPAVGRFYTGPDPGDTRFYLPARHEPAFHAGLPFLRLDRRSGEGPHGVEHAFGIHGPVTPSLIWGPVSSGCIRMQPDHLRWLYAFARRHPGLSVEVVSGLDRPGGQTVAPDPGPAAPAGCPEARLGARRLRRARLRDYVHDRLCGAVDHWFVVELRGGETLRARVQHGGGLRLELYGIRGISRIAAGEHALDHTVPVAHRNRGDRYLRITALGKTEGAALPYTLTLSP